MANKTIYKITITNFEKHNKGMKKGYKKFMLSTGFLSDAKIRQLTPATTLLFLSCIAVAAESTSSHIEVTHESLCYQSRVKSGSLQSQLDLLQSLQLLNYEKVATNRIEKNRIEVNRIESPARSKKPTEEQKNLNKKIWESYAKAYFDRYKVDPVRNASVNAKISQLAKRLGEEAVDIVAFYLTHNDFLFVKNTHAIGLCLSSCESLRTQFLRGKTITSQDVRDFEKTNYFAEQMKRMGGE